MSDLRDYLVKGYKLNTSASSFYCLPTGPVGGTQVDDGSAGAYGSWVEISSSAPENLYIVGITVAGMTAAWCQIAIGTGAAAAEVVVTEVFAVDTNMIPIWPPIPIPSGTRISSKCATDTGTNSYKCTLMCVAQADVLAF